MGDSVLPCVRGTAQPDPLILTIDQCRDVVRWWCDRLHLSHWVVDVRFGRAGSMKGDCAQLSFVYPRSRATVTVLDPIDHNFDDYDPIDMEHAIVHELVHLVTAAWLEWTWEDAKIAMGKVDEGACIERPTESLAWTLIDLRRSSPDLRVFSWEVDD